MHLESILLCNRVRLLAGILSAQFRTLRPGQCHRHKPESKAERLPFPQDWDRDPKLKPVMMDIIS